MNADESKTARETLDALESMGLIEFGLPKNQIAVLLSRIRRDAIITTHEYELCLSWVFTHN